MSVVKAAGGWECKIIHFKEAYWKSRAIKLQFSTETLIYKLPYVSCRHISQTLHDIKNCWLQKCFFFTSKKNSLKLRFSDCIWWWYSNALSGIPNWLKLFNELLKNCAFILAEQTKEKTFFHTQNMLISISIAKYIKCIA